MIEYDRMSKKYVKVGITPNKVIFDSVLIFEGE